MSIHRPARSALATAIAAVVVVPAFGPLLAQSSARHATAAVDSIDVRVSEGSRLAFDLSPDGRSIVFDLLGQLWVLPAAGGEARPITNAVRDVAEDLDPAYAPDDGRRVLFRGERNGVRGLWLLEGETRPPRLLARIPEGDAFLGSAAWSPDGRVVAYARVLPPDSAVARVRSEVVLLDVASGAERVLRADGPTTLNARDPAWSHDGVRIAFVADRATSPRGGPLWIVDARGGPATPITADSAEALAPALSPDGRTVAYFARDSARRLQLWVREVADRNGARLVPLPRRLTSHADVAPTRARWTPDGRALLYSADGRLWRVAVDGGVPAEVPFTARLAFTRARRSLPPARIALPGDTRPARGFMGLALSPDARRVAAIALGKLWVIPVGGAAHAVASVPTTARHLAWSPDGTQVAWSAGAFDHEDLFATTLTTGATRRLTALPGRETLPAYSPDGRRLAFVHVTDSGGPVLRVVDARTTTVLDTAGTRALGRIGLSWTASNVTAPVWTPAGDGLLTSGGWAPDAPTRGIVLRLAGGADTLARFPDAPIFIQWTRSGSVVFVRHDRLWRAPFDASTGMLAPARPLGSAPALYASAARDGSVLFVSGDGLRLRAPGGRERRLGWPVTYAVPVAPPLVVRNVRVVDGTGAPPTAPRDVLVERGVIARIAPAGTVAPPAGARVLDGGGAFAIPGLMDLHAHDYRPDLLPHFLYFGVTTVRDQGSDVAPLVAYADAIDAGVLEGARAAYGGFQFYSDWPFDEEQGRGIDPEADANHVHRSVALAVSFGAQHVKTRTFRRWDVNARMIEEAHRRGLRATGHCAAPLPLVAAGMDAKEHILMCNSRVGAYYLSDAHVYDDEVQLYRAAGVSVVPTITYLSLAARLAARPAWLDDDAELAPFLPPRVDFDWMTKLGPEERADMERAAQGAREAVAKLARAGVTIGTGTDVWQVPTGVHMELEELVAAGLSPLAAIRAATGDAARIVGAERSLGTIAIGKVADLVLLDANPVDDIRNTRRIRAVVKAGRVVDRAAIRAAAAAAH